MDTEAIRARSHKTNSVGKSKFLAAFIMANLKPSSLSIKVTCKKKNGKIKFQNMSQYIFNIVELLQKKFSINFLFVKSGFSEAFE